MGCSPHIQEWVEYGILSPQLRHIPAWLFQESARLYPRGIYIAFADQWTLLSLSMLISSPRIKASSGAI
jgi:hypothetical protein